MRHQKEAGSASISPVTLPLSHAQLRRLSLHGCVALFGVVWWSDVLDFAMVSSSAPCTAAAVFTTNKFQAAPVIASRTLLQTQVTSLMSTHTLPHPLSLSLPLPSSPPH